MFISRIGVQIGLILLLTRMHSSRMRTGRSQTVCRSLLRGGGGAPSRGGFLHWGGSPSGGVLHLGGFSIQGGSPSRGVLHLGGFSIQGGVLHPGGFSIGGGCLLWGGLHARGGLARRTPPPTPPPVNRMTDRCKNITLAKTSFRPVIMKNPCQELGLQSCKIVPVASCRLGYKLPS